MIKIIIFTLIGLSAAQYCPPAEVLHPCTCDETGDFAITCEGIRDNFNLKGVFDNASVFVEDWIIFHRLNIVDTPLTIIEEEAIQRLKFYTINIDRNSKLTYISPRAFNASRDITIQMWITQNPIENEPPNERDIFDFINSFKNLMSVTLRQSRVSSVPGGAFSRVKELIFINLEGNNISSIGSRAFSDTLPFLGLHLNDNPISTAGLHKKALDGINNDLFLSLYCTGIDYLDQTRFQSVLDGAESIRVGDVFDFCPNSEYARLHCDERADWICENEERYRGRLEGFRCETGTGYDDIWEYCKEKAKNNTN